jgi:pimeloyl-ACP methyl ester carboxylesterase
MRRTLLKRLGAGAVLMLAAACSSPSGTTTAVSTTVVPETTTTASTLSLSTTTTVPETTSTTQEETTTPEAHSIDVSFPTEGLDLAGTLRMPATDDPAPAVVLIAGSGPASRDEVLPGQLDMTFGFDIPVFKELAEALQSNGFAVLTYDKRTCGPFNGCADNGYRAPSAGITIDAFIGDATAAVDFLRSRSDIDPKRIAVIGHSQGAEFITVMLAADPQLAGGVMVGGPYRPIDQIIEYQLDFTLQLLEEGGMTKDQALSLPPVASMAEMVDGLKALRAGGTDPVADTSAEFWNSWFDLHDETLDAAKEISQPLLVLNGEMDWNVPVSEADAWRQYLESIGSNAEVQTLPCVTHALNCVQGTDPLSITPADVGRHVDPSVVDALVQFLGR